MNEILTYFQELKAQLSYDTVYKVVNRVLSEQKELILIMQKDQLAAGIDSMERNLRPNYLQDPFFKSTEKAKGYERFKNSKAKKPMVRLGQYQPAVGGTPNLYISGLYYSGLHVKEAKIIGSNVSIKVDNIVNFALKVAEKYGRELLGLTEKHLNILFELYINPDLEDELFKKNTSRY